MDLGSAPGRERKWSQAKAEARLVAGRVVIGELTTQDRFEGSRCAAKVDYDFDSSSSSAVVWRG